MYKELGASEIAIDFYKEVRKTAIEVKDYQTTCTAANNLGLAYQQLGIYKTALNYYQESLAISENIKDSANIADSFINIGVLHLYTSNFEISETYFLKALKYYKNVRDTAGIWYCHNNYALILQEKQPLKALQLFEQNLILCKTWNKPEYEAITYANMANIQLDMGLYQQAQANYLLVFSILEKYHSSDLSNYYNNFSTLNLKIKKYETAIYWAHKALKIALETKSKKFQADAYKNLFEGNNALKKYDEALHYYILYKQQEDSLVSNEDAKAITRMEMQYQFNKTQREKELAHSAALRQQKVVIISTLIGFILVLISALLIWRNRQTIKRTNILLHHKNVEILQQKEEIETQRDNLEYLNNRLMEANVEITAQRDYIHEKQKVLEIQHNEIQASIFYAQRIQQALLPAQHELSCCFPEHFILYKPRNIVSGDFYWLKHIGNTVYFALADCTGHGVPGAFMSILGMSLLNEIINKRTDLHANEVLDILRNKIKKMLKQQGNVLEQSDGMDISFLILKKETLQMEFSGAFNPIYILRKNSISEINEINEINEYTLTEYKANKQPIGIHVQEIPFSNNVIQLQANDTLYLLSDGFADQIGGSLQKKFMTKNVRNLLNNIQHLNMQEQYNTLNNTIESWQNGFEQIDDISLIGIKII